MKRRKRLAREDAEERWPTLYQFLAAYCHQDWPYFYGSPAGAVDAAVGDYPLELRQKVLREWRDWHAGEGSQDDVRASVNDGLGVEVYFKRAEEAHDFMTMVHDKLVASVKSETSERWRE